MRIQQCGRVGLVQKIVLLALLTFLAYGGKNTMAFGMSRKLAFVTPEKEQKLQQAHLETEPQNVKKNPAAAVFSSSKREVPDVSDPLHNR